jgi:isocitrate/isopropylmalate dehydrogenase
MYQHSPRSSALPGNNNLLHDQKLAEIDFVYIRENTEGEYAGAGTRLHSAYNSNYRRK